jgi:ATP-dependent Lhr-like helicase
VRHYLHADNVKEILVQALLAAPVFIARWRWVCNIALAVRRNRNGKRIPAQLQRMDSEDLIAVVFPDQLACQENIVGHREVPDHPLVNQTIFDCLHDARDIDGLQHLLSRLEQDEVEIVVRDLASPSPLAQEILTARPYAFLDDAPAEERRTSAVQARGYMDPQSAGDLGRLDPLAIEQVHQEAWPQAHTADELHDALLIYGFLTAEEGESGNAQGRMDHGVSALEFGWRHLFDSLVAQKRATKVRRGAGPDLWVAAERLAQIAMLYPDARSEPSIPPVPTKNHGVESDSDALRELLRSRLEGLGPVTAEALSATFALPVSNIESALYALEAEGFVMRGDFDGNGVEQWCERRLLARIHRYTIKTLRKQVEPVTCGDFMRFLFDWQRVSADQRGQGDQALLSVVEQLAGFEGAAAAWEGEILASRVTDYAPNTLDRLCLAGRVQWLRLGMPKSEQHRGSSIRATPIILVLRKQRRIWEQFAGAKHGSDRIISATAQRITEIFAQRGALFFDELVELSGMLRSHVEQALGELVACGMVTSDGFSGLRALMVPTDRRRPFGTHRRRRAAVYGIEEAGRWTLVRYPDASSADDCEPGEALSEIAWTLLHRYGVVCRRLLDREAAWIPPWRLLLPVFRRLEARGEIRGGRFVAGLSGEQFALIEAVGLLREVRRRAKDGVMVSVSGADPLNLVGIVVPGPRIPALAGNRVLFRDGAVIASQVGKQVSYRVELDDAARWDAHNLLVKRTPVAHLRAH